MGRWRNSFFGPKAVLTHVLSSLPPREVGITKVYFVDELPSGGGGPACCLRSTGECWVNRPVWKRLTYEQRVFVLLHENEHILQDSSDELAVDAEAHRKYMRMGFSLTESVKALTRVLSFTSEEHSERAREQAVRATVYDITVNGNKKLLTKLKRLDEKRRQQN